MQTDSCFLVVIPERNSVTLAPFFMVQYFLFFLGDFLNPSVHSCLLFIYLSVHPLARPFIYPSIHTSMYPLTHYMDQASITGKDFTI